MRTDTPQTIYIKDYKPYPFTLLAVHLDFNIRDGKTVVTTVTKFEKKSGLTGDLYLNGEDLELVSITLDGKTPAFIKDDKSLTIKSENLPHSFTLEIVTAIRPETNTRLEGLYMSGGNYCTQCEAEGFRRITYFPDRPDVMSVYTVRIEADKDQFPVLLSNGNLLEHDIVTPHPNPLPQGEGTSAARDEGVRHYKIWHDPHPKPCYLFALVAGDLAHVHDTFTTQSGRRVDLYIYVRPGDESQCGHAMESLKKSMTWDEDVYGLEYDLDIFNIVAVSDFNMGAMENKSLNIFNTALVLAAQDTATDSDFLRVESVIAHEYFHNWSGNRITCRDWFQLSLKEGLTVFRDQEFSGDLNSRTVQRIDDVTHLRRLQFAEDSGPMAHPIRPDQYIEINNFYTMTVYEKGAEVIRMTRTILGAEHYRKATDLYFSRHDGQAVTCDEWLTCMKDASGVDLSQFRLWYAQAGTPEVHFEGHYDADKKTYTVTLSQKTPDTPGQSEKKPLHIPVAIGLIDDKGQSQIDTEILHLKSQTQNFTIENIQSKPVPSLLRNFSAPVKLKADLTDHELKHLMRYDTDGFNRWDAAQRLYLRTILSMMSNGNHEQAGFMDTYGSILENAISDKSDKALMSRMLTLPDISTIGQEQDIVDPPSIYNARLALLAGIKRSHKTQIEKLYAANAPAEVFSVSAEAMARRALRNTALSLLTCTQGTGCAKLAKAHYDSANTMTDRIAALGALAGNKNPEREDVFTDFYNRFKCYPLVVDKWFAMQASAVRDDLIDHLKTLKAHPDFNIKNPNRVRSLYASFAMNNPAIFHAADGSGYEFLTDAIIELNDINPQIAARLLTPLRDWRRYSPDRQQKMKVALERILKISDISPDVFEIASKTING